MRGYINRGATTFASQLITARTRLGTTRIALVTGGSRGLGRRAELTFADCGVDVIFTYKSNAEAARSW